MNFKQKLLLQFVRLKFKLLSTLHKPTAAKELFKLFCTPLQKSILKSLPKNAKEEDFIFKTLKISGFTWNENAVKTLLILHGFSSAAYKFTHFAEAAVEKGYRVLAFDAPAHGLSDGKQTNALEYAEMILKINKIYGKVDAYIAHSFGGLGLSLALEALEDNENIKVALIAPATESTTALNKVYEALKLKDEKVEQLVHKHIINISGKPIEWFSINRVLQNTRANILWVHDEDDNITPLKDTLPTRQCNLSNIKFVITKGLGHQKIYRDETVKKEVINFL